MIIIKTKEEIKKIRDGGRILSKILKQVSNKAKQGVSTENLNIFAEELIKKNKAEPSLKITMVSRPVYALQLMKKLFMVFL